MFSETRKKIHYPFPISRNDDNVTLDKTFIFTIRWYVLGGN